MGAITFLIFSAVVVLPVADKYQPATRPAMVQAGVGLETWMCKRVTKCDPNSPNRVAPVGAW